MKKNKLNLKPLADRGWVIKPTASEERTESGTYVPDAAQEKLQTGSIVSIGPGRVDTTVEIGMGVTDGDRVTYGK